MKVLISSLLVCLMSGALSAGFAQATPFALYSCDPPPDQPKPPKK